MLAFGLTIFWGAFLLFLVQPLIARFILPWFGGGPAVWTACMLFFQVMLLAGYAYAHCSITWLRPRQQVLLHLALLALAVCFLPIAPGEQWKPVGNAQPTGHILWLLLQHRRRKASVLGEHVERMHDPGIGGLGGAEKLVMLSPRIVLARW